MKRSGGPHSVVCMTETYLRLAWGFFQPCPCCPSRAHYSCDRDSYINLLRLSSSDTILDVLRRDRGFQRVRANRRAAAWWFDHGSAGGLKAQDQTPRANAGGISFSGADVSLPSKKKHLCPQSPMLDDRYCGEFFGCDVYT